MAGMTQDSISHDSLPCMPAGVIVLIAYRSNLHALHHLSSILRCDVSRLLESAAATPLGQISNSTQRPAIRWMSVGLTLVLALTLPLRPGQQHVGSLGAVEFGEFGNATLLPDTTKATVREADQLLQVIAALHLKPAPCSRGSVRC